MQHPPWIFIKDSGSRLTQSLDAPKRGHSAGTGLMNIPWGIKLIDIFWDATCRSNAYI